MKFNNMEITHVVCGHGLSVKSDLCSICDKRCHKGCSGVVGSFYSVHNFVCPRQSGLTAGSNHSVDDSIQFKCGNIEEVKSFCYLEDTLQCKRGAERSVCARVYQPWLKWRKISYFFLQLQCANQKKGSCIPSFHALIVFYAAET